MNSSLAWIACPRLVTFLARVSFLRTVSQHGFEVDESQSDWLNDSYQVGGWSKDFILGRSKYRQRPSLEVKEAMGWKALTDRKHWAGVGLWLLFVVDCGELPCGSVLRTHGQGTEERWLCWEPASYPGIRFLTKREIGLAYALALLFR